MPPVLRALPYFDQPTDLLAPGVRERARPYQIVVWVSVTPVEQYELPPDARRFPAILDTGLNDGFAVTPVHLRLWAGVSWDTPPEDGSAKFYDGIPIPGRRAYLWLHPNQYGWRDQIDPLRPAVRVELEAGITVYGNDEQVGPDPRTKAIRGPRLPLIGLRALTGLGARLTIDCTRRVVSLGLPD